MAIDEAKLLREHYEIMADIKGMKERELKRDRMDDDWAEKLSFLEEAARKNMRDHEDLVKDLETFAKADTLVEIKTSLEALRGTILIQTPAQARSGGDSWVQILFRNPTYILWVILGAVVLLMVIMGYSLSEIGSVLDRMK